MFLLPLAGHAAPERFYVGDFTNEGIYTGLIDSETGALGNVKVAVKAGSPGFLALSPNGSFLFAVTSGDSVSAFCVEKDGGLVALNGKPCGGAGPVHLSVDPSGKNVLVANYDSGDITCIRIREDGELGELASKAAFKGSGPDPDRQQKPYPHFITMDGSGRFVYACDLGTDHVWSYPFNALTGIIGKPLETQGSAPAGSGCRHLAFGPGEEYAYVNGEMGRNVTVFKRDPSTGSLTAIQTIPLVPGTGPAAGITTAEVVCHPSGKWLYVSSRGDDIIAVFAIGSDGKLTFIQDVPCLVQKPRSFGIDPSGRWLIAAGQRDGRIAVLRIAEDSGRLSRTGQEAMIPEAVCVVFSKVQR